MHYIKDIFEKVESEHAHNKFVRYSKGDFVGPQIKIKFSKANIKVITSFHLIDELLSFVVKVLGNKEVHLKGQLVWNEDLGPELAELGIKYSKVSKSRGIFKYQLENDINVKDFYESMTKYNILVNIKEEEVTLTTKNNFPKPNKEVAADFCKTTFPASMKAAILKEFAFDVKTEAKKELIIKNQIIVEDIELPKDAPDFDTARRQAKRVGTINRVVIIDGEETKTEVKFKV